jgi:glycylpeptide N-tetradecanoyltransferase
VHALLSAYLTKFDLHFEFSKPELQHFILPRPNVIDTYVVENESTKELTDFFSFYHLPSSILKHEKHKTLRVAYAFYNVANTVSMEELMKNALILAKQKDLDVFNALDIMENEKMLKELKFGVGDGHLHYYLYNWRVPELPPQ